MKKSDEIVPSVQVEVWKMKEKVYEDNKGMNCAEYFRYLSDKKKSFLSGRKNVVRKVGKRKTLIVDKSTRRLAALGGTQPSLKAGVRRRR